MSDALFWQALALHRNGKLDEAAGLYRDTVAAEATHFDAWHLLGVLEAQRNNLPIAETSIRRAMQIRPDDASAHANLGKILHAGGKPADALTSLDTAIRIDPDNIEARFEYGNVLRALHRSAEALDRYADVLRSDPNHVGALNNRGAMLSAIGQPREALVCFERVLVAQPNSAEAHWNAALEYLRLGNFSAGLPHYEWRWQTPWLKAHRHDFGLPLWLGQSSPEGKRILVWAEQGLGDTLQFCRFVKQLAARGATVLLSVQPPLKTLLSRLDGVHRLLADGDPVPEADFQCPLLSLPLACETSLATISAEPGYLHPDPALVARWAAMLGPKNQPRVGLVWSGNIALPYNLRRAVPVEKILALAQGPFEFVCLHKELTAHDRTVLATRPDIRIFADALEGFHDTAALIENLDLVVAVDTAVVHLAGGLGKPVWVLLPFTTDWRWFVDRDDSPWYPTARLFRQPKPAAWDPVLATIAAELAQIGQSGAPSEWLQRAVALHRQGKPDAAATMYRAMLALWPKHFDALHLLGVALAQMGNPAAAIEPIGRALAVRPDEAVANGNMALALRDAGRATEALAYFDRAVRADPTNVAMHNAQGMVSIDLGRSAEAMRSFDAALAVAPDDPDALNNKGSASMKLDRPADALAAYDRALRSRPDSPSVLVNRGLALWGLGRPTDALASYDRALAIDPDCFEALCNRARMLRELHRMPDAIATVDRILHVRPDSAEFRFSSATYRLLHGDFGGGWPAYESRWDFADLKGTRPDFGRPNWLGHERLDGKSILLSYEQGFGDTLQFCRFARLVAAQGARVVLRVQPPLKSLLTGLAGVDTLLAADESIPPTDFQCALMSLPLACGIDAAAKIPAEPQYLRCDAERGAQWQAILGPRRRPRIGLAWFGNPFYRRDRDRSVPLDCFAALADGPFDCVGLHRERRPEDTAASSAGIATVLDESHDFHDIAAAIGQLDLVISVDTAIAHLAAALGCPTWIALPFVPDWRWQLDRADSPWYPTVRLFRQPTRGDWFGTVQAIRQALLAAAADGTLRTAPRAC